MANEQTFRSGKDSLVLGQTEGGGAPMLIIQEEGLPALGYASASYVFADPAQVSLLIRALIPFADPKTLT